MSSLFYSAAFGFYLALFSRGRDGVDRLARVSVRAGFLFGTFYLVSEAVREGFFIPVADLSQALAFFAWSIVFVYLGLIAGKKNESFGLVLTPVLILLTVAAGATVRLAAKPVPVSPNNYFAVHIVCAYLAYAAFAVSFAACLLYLIQHRQLKRKHPGPFYHRLPSLEELDALIYQPLAWGTLLLVLAMIVGSLWARSAFGTFWISEPKTVASAVTVLVYAGILHLRYRSALRGRRAVLYSLAAFAVMVAGFVVPRFMGGLHSF